MLKSYREKGMADNDGKIKVHQIYQPKKKYAQIKLQFVYVSLKSNPNNSLES